MNMESEESSQLVSDVRAYNDYASAAVDLSQAQHFPAAVISGMGEGGDGTGDPPPNDCFSVVRSVRDIDSNVKRRYVYTATMPAVGRDGSSTPLATISSPPVQLSDDVQWRLASPSGNKVAVLVKKKTKNNDNNGGDEQQILQIWTHGGHQLERIIALDQKLHGKVVHDAGGFGRPAWNGPETALVYSAERNSPETASFFDRDESKNSQKSSTAKIVGGEYALGQGKTESWGEKYNQQSALLDLFVVNVEIEDIQRVTNVPGEESRDTSEGGFTLGQAVWSPSGSSIVYVGWDAGGGAHMPRRLGMIYCQNRPSKLYLSGVAGLLAKLGKEDAVDDSAVIDAGYHVLTPDLWIAKSPRFSPVCDEGSRLLFLAAEKAFDTHNGCFGLHSIDWTVKGTKDEPALHTSNVVVPQVWNPLQDKTSNAKNAVGNVAGMPFPGLFVAELPPNPFISRNSLITTTQWGSCSKLVKIALSTGRVEMIVPCNDKIESIELLCVGHDGSAFVLVRLPTQPGTVWRIPNSVLLGSNGEAPDNSHVVMKFRPLASTKFSRVQDFPTLDYDFGIEVLSDVAEFSGVDADHVQSILMIPNKQKHPKPPLIVCPHGGPHSAYATTFFHSLAYLCGHGGYAIIVPNYRGR